MNASVVFDNLVHQYGSQVAVISVYTSGGSPPFYNANAYQKIRSYPPPYYSSGNWYFATPWLWVDGNKKPAYITSTWSTYINQALQVPSDLEIVINQLGGWEGSTLDMEITINNTGQSTISGNLHCVLTENGIQWSAPNGQQIHNHVPRIWWPDQNGMSVSIPSGDGSTIPINWTLQPAWNTDSLWVVAYLQSNTMQPDSTMEIYQGASVKVSDMPTAIETEENEIVQDYLLFQNYPNPFNPATAISYQLPEESQVEITIYNLLGQQIRTLVNDKQPAGTYELRWDGSDKMSNEVAGGIYIYQLKAGTFVKSRKMLLIK